MQERGRWVVCGEKAGGWLGGALAVRAATLRPPTGNPPALTTSGGKGASRPTLGLQAGEQLGTVGLTR